MTSSLKNFSKLCVHTITTRPWPIETAIEKYAAAGIGGMTVWLEWLEGHSPEKIGQQIRQAGLSVVSLCRGGFFPATSPQGRQKAIDENRQAIETAVALGAPLLVLVCGAIPEQSLTESRKQIQEGIASILEHAHAGGVKLAIEPLHPMYASNRSAINTLAQANDFCEIFQDSHVGVAVDVYHLWWDSNLQQEIERCGQANRLFAFHICDWLTPTQDFLNDRGLMGQGCINLPEIRGWVESAGFAGFHEVEIFSNHWWEQDQDAFLAKIQQAYLRHS